MSYYYNTGRLPRGLAENLQTGNMAAIAESIRQGIATVHGQRFEPLVRRREEEAELFAEMPAQARGEPLQVAQAAPVRGGVDVTLTHRNPPPGTALTATATGDATIAPPRVEFSQLAVV